MNQIQITFTRRAKTGLKFLSRIVKIELLEWLRIVEVEGYLVTKNLAAYRDHELRGNRVGQRSASLSFGYRVIYKVKIEYSSVKIIILEITKHEY